MPLSLLFLRKFRILLPRRILSFHCILLVCCILLPFFLCLRDFFVCFLWLSTCLSSEKLEETHLPLCIIQLFCAEQFDHTVFSVKSRYPFYLPVTQTPDPFSHTGTGYSADILQGEISQDIKFRSQF